NHASVGGALANGGIMVVADHSDLYDNNASFGGGIWSANRDARLFVLDSTLQNNVASDKAGGILLEDGTLLTINCEFLANHAQTGSGGAIAIDESMGPALMVGRNCTFVLNSAGQSGGAIFNSYTATATVAGCTLTNNTAMSGGGIYNDSNAVLNL